MIKWWANLDAKTQISVSQISKTNAVGVGFLFNKNQIRVMFFVSVSGLVARKKCPGSVNRIEERPKDSTNVQIDDYWNEP